MIQASSDQLRRAPAVQWVLAVRSQCGRTIPDLLVAAAAELEGSVVLHDRDFDFIAKATGQDRRWVVPAGTID